MSRILINPNPTYKKDTPMGGDFLKVSEFFCDTIQGEGIYSGVPAVFLRLQGCTLNCTFCDTKDIWNNGNPYSFYELFRLMEQPRFNVITKLFNGHHLVITGGSPLRQQINVVKFITAFTEKYAFRPFIEIENECILSPITGMVDIVDCWNNSPKLQNAYTASIDMDVIKLMSSLENSWFKFVIEKEEDWNEIEVLLTHKIIKRSQILLMPMGVSIEEISKNSKICVDLAIKNSVRYTQRTHINLWGSRKSI
jgi:organic radical activating enzyme